MIKLKDLQGRYEVKSHITQVLDVTNPSDIPYNLDDKLTDGVNTYELYSIDVNPEYNEVILGWRLC